MRILCSSLVALWLMAPTGTDTDTLTFFEPTVVLSRADRDRLTRGNPLVRFLPASGHEIVAFTAIAVSPAVTADRAAAWMRRAEELRDNRYIIVSQRLSPPPRLSDFDRLVLDDDDLEDIRRCVPGRCGVKLAAADIATLARAAVDAGSGWKPVVQQAFREMLLRRVLSFTAGGFPALDDIVDKRRPSTPADAIGALVEHTAFLRARVPEVEAQLLRCPDVSDANGESFIYWSKERLGGRPVITITQVTLIARPDHTPPSLLLVGTQVYASHYLDASLTVTAFVEDASASRGYLVYLHRASVDLLGGLWGGIARSLIESTVRKDAPAILRSVGGRLANADPPGATAPHARPSR
jgi:hypothetical protein